MIWKDEGLVLSTRRYGENSLIVNLLTIKHGRHSGMVRAGSSTRNRGLYQPGNHLQCSILTSIMLVSRARMGAQNSVPHRLPMLAH